MFLKRGGRLSGAAAVAGTLLGIKPVLHVDSEGKLIPMEKVRGRRASLDALVKHYKDGALDKTGTVFISHGDCLADAQYVAEKIRAIGAGRIELNMIGPVIGAHSRPGHRGAVLPGHEPVKHCPEKAHSGPDAPQNHDQKNTPA